jgi:hypothetical protein
LGIIFFPSLLDFLGFVEKVFQNALSAINPSTWAYNRLLSWLQRKGTIAKWQLGVSTKALLHRTKTYYENKIINSFQNIATGQSIQTSFGLFMMGVMRAIADILGVPSWHFLSRTLLLPMRVISLWFSKV